MKASRRYYRRRWRHPLVLLAVILGLVGYFSVINPSPHGCGQGDIHGAIPHLALHRHLLETEDITTTESPNASKPTPETAKPSAQFPEDLFTEGQRAQGAIVLHVIGMIYMFVALAIVCDEFFVPSLDVIIEKCDISEDVAGATFMAAGGSAPELFTSIIGVFISYDDVGIGTIVGSAVFNILFVISMCAIFSKSALSLTWWPLFRDVSFYSLALVTLILFFGDNVIYWYEALVLLLCYAAYVTFMKFNENIEKAVKKLLNRAKVTRVGSSDHLMPQHLKRRVSTPILHAGSKFRHGLLQLMIHSIDPLHEGKLDDKASQLHAIASLRVLLDATKPTTVPNGTVVPHSASAHGGSCQSCGLCNCAGAQSSHTTSTTTGETHVVNSTDNRTVTVSDANEVTRVDTMPSLQSEIPSVDGSLNNSIASGLGSNGTVRKDSQDGGKSIGSNSIGKMSTIAGESVGSPTSIAERPPAPPPPDKDLEEDKDGPLDMSWPDECKKRINYLLVAPIVFPLWATLPDVRRPEKKKWFIGSFVGSIIWIAIFSYLMVWWATMVGDTLGIPNEIMGLTFLAAGTSIPDLITSVLVARKGFGDMAVSSSVGSNIFDVTVGLPFPWLLACIISGPVTVNSHGMACSICILFLMLLFVIITIAAFKWRLNIGLAMVMFFLYFIFIVCSLLLEKGIVKCSVIMGFFTGN